MLGMVYSNLVTVTGIAPFQFSLISGTLPYGLLLDAITGTISGVPTTASNYSFIISEKDATGCSALGNYEVLVTGKSSFFIHRQTTCLACGNSILDVGEQCDGELCCTVNCTTQTDLYVCRPSIGICDVEERCNGTSALCPKDLFATRDVVCRPVVGVCDLEEKCNGSSPICPTDLFATSEVVCRPVAGVCDLAEWCNGQAATCPPDVLVSQDQVVCRQSAGVCDAIEKCNGVDATCPPDQYIGPDTVCRKSTDTCDPSEYCSGTDPNCPINVDFCGKFEFLLLDLNHLHVNCRNGFNKFYLRIEPN